MRKTTLCIIAVIVSGIFLVSPQVVSQTSISLADRITSEGLDVLFCSYFGGDGEEWSNDVCFTDDGGFVITGMSRSDDLPVQNAYQSDYAGGGDVFIVKLNSLLQVEFYTYFGGDGLEEPMALTVDDEGNIILAGGTSSSNLTVLNPMQNELNGTSDAFLAKFSPSGNLIFSTYFGGSGFDRIEDIVIDSSGNYVITGPTGSHGLNTSSGAFQTVFGGGSTDVYIATISPDGQSILHSTYLGNTTDDDAWAIGIDSLGDVVIVGMTDGDMIATESVYQQTYGGGTTDAFVAKLTQDYTTLSWVTLLGGDGWEFGDQVDFDSSNNVVVSGYTGSSDFPLANQLYNDTGHYDAFLSKLDPNGETLLMSSYLGGSNEDRSYAMEVLPGDAVLIACPSSSSDMPVQNPFLSYSGYSDGYIALISGNESSLLYGSHYGGSHNDYVLGMSVSEDERIAVIGYTSSDDLPTHLAVQNEYGGVSDTMVWVFGFEQAPPPVEYPPIITIATVVVAIVAVVVFISLRRRR